MFNYRRKSNCFPKKISVCFVFFFCLCVFLGPYPWHMEVPRLGIELELQLLAYATATATWDLSHVCNLHHSSRQCPIFNPLSEARDQTRNLMVPSQICFCCATTGTLQSSFLIFSPEPVCPPPTPPPLGLSPQEQRTPLLLDYRA